MIVPIPGRLGQMTGWKAVVGALVILGFIALGIWSKLAPHSLGDGTWSVEPGHYAASSIRATRAGQLKVDVAPVGATGEYMICVMDAPSKAKLGTDDPNLITKIASHQGTGHIILPHVALGEGTYYVVALNMGAEKITLKYDIMELTND